MCNNCGCKDAESFESEWDFGDDRESLREGDEHSDFNNAWRWIFKTKRREWPKWGQKFYDKYKWTLDDPHWNPQFDAEGDEISCSCQSPIVRHAGVHPRTCEACDLIVDAEPFEAPKGQKFTPFKDAKSGERINMRINSHDMKMFDKLEPYPKTMTLKNLKDGKRYEIRKPQKGKGAEIVKRIDAESFDDEDEGVCKLCGVRRAALNRACNPCRIKKGLRPYVFEKGYDDNMYCGSCKTKMKGYGEGHYCEKCDNPKITKMDSESFEAENDYMLLEDYEGEGIIVCSNDKEKVRTFLRNSFMGLCLDVYANELYMMGLDLEILEKKGVEHPTIQNQLLKWFDSQTFAKQITWGGFRDESKVLKSGGFYTQGESYIAPLIGFIDNFKAESFDAEYSVDKLSKMSFREIDRKSGFLGDRLANFGVMDSWTELTNSKRKEILNKIKKKESWLGWEAEGFEGESPMVKNITAIGVLALAILAGKKLTR